MEQPTKTTKAGDQVIKPSLLRCRKIIGDDCGAAALEFMLIFPLLMLLIYAVIEFGWYFVRYEAATGAANNITQAIIQNPTAISYASEVNAGAGIVGPFNTGSNYICANSYTTLAAAQAGGCSNGQWTTGAPAGIAQGSGAPYYVAVTVYAQPASLTGMVNEILPKGTAITRSVVTPVPNIATSNGLPTGCAAGQVVTSNGSGGFSCSSLSNPCTVGQVLSSDGAGGYQCLSAIPSCPPDYNLTFNGLTRSFNCTLGTAGLQNCIGVVGLELSVGAPVVAQCPSGYTATGGGSVGTVAVGSPPPFLAYSEPSGLGGGGSGVSGWVGLTALPGGGGIPNTQTLVICCPYQ